MISMPPVRGTLTADRPLAELTWLRVGGPAEWFFQPADAADLSAFLAALDPSVAVFPMGVGSNLIVRDGGLPGVTVRLGRAFAGLRIAGDRVTAGAAMLDARVARQAAAAGLDLTFLRTIPGSIGGALRMNAGCYGTYVADVCEAVEVVGRDGTRARLPASGIAFGYRQTDLPPDTIVTAVTFRAPRGAPAALEARMADQVSRRDASQPTRDRTAGSTFRNPAGHSSTGAPAERQDLKAWKVIEAAGLRGARRGGAVVNAMHTNFLTNAGAPRPRTSKALARRFAKGSSNTAVFG